MRNRRNIRYRSHFQPQGLNRTDSGLAPGARAFDEHGHFLEAHCHRSFYRLLSREASRKRRAFPRALESSRTRAPPGYGIALPVGHCDNCVIKCRVDMNLSCRQRSLYFLCSAFSACSAYTLSHSTSQYVSNLVTSQRPITYRGFGSPAQIAAGWKVTPSGQQQHSRGKRFISWSRRGVDHVLRRSS